MQEEDLCTQLFSALRPKPPLLSHHMVVHRSVPASMGKAEAAAEAEAAEVEAGADGWWVPTPPPAPRGEDLDRAAVPAKVFRHCYKDFSFFE